MKRQNHKPFFSIVIPTYNRSAYLLCAIKGILKQKERDFEIIVSDNCSTDNTKHLMSKVSDSRVRYIRSNKNLGWIANLQRAIDHANGTYIFMHGDDDYVFDENCLFKLKKLLNQRPVGFVRLNYLTYTKRNDNLFDVHNPKLKDQFIQKNIENEEVMSFIQSIDPFFITGQVFARKFLKKTSLIQSEYVPWFPAMFQAIYHGGAFVLPDYLFVASWSQNDMPRYKMAGGKLAFERYYEEVKKRVNRVYYQNFLKHQLDIVVGEFPAAKYYLPLVKFWHYALHVLDLDQTKKKSFRFWTYFFLSLCTPKFILSLGKKYAQNIKRSTGDQKTYDSIAIFRKI